MSNPYPQPPPAPNPYPQNFPTGVGSLPAQKNPTVGCLIKALMTVALIAIAAAACVAVSNNVADRLDEIAANVSYETREALQSEYSAKIKTCDIKNTRIHIVGDITNTGTEPQAFTLSIGIYDSVDVLLGRATAPTQMTEVGQTSRWSQTQYNLPLTASRKALGVKCQIEEVHHTFDSEDAGVLGG